MSARSLLPVLRGAFSDASDDGSGSDLDDGMAATGEESVPKGGHTSERGVLKRGRARAEPQDDTVERQAQAKRTVEEPAEAPDGAGSEVGGRHERVEDEKNSEPEAEVVDLSRSTWPYLACSSYRCLHCMCLLRSTSMLLETVVFKWSICYYGARLERGNVQCVVTAPSPRAQATGLDYLGCIQQE